MNLLQRPFWIGRIHALWRQKSIVWLSGVRRTGKTSLCRLLEPAIYFNCDLPSVQRQCLDPEFLLRELPPGKPLILDEIHRLADPSQLLKIAADVFPDRKIIATGSSTLDASRKFRDTLTDRKRALHLPPVLWRECGEAFGGISLDRRLLHGGLPPQLLAAQPIPEFFEDWTDSFYARDIQELFGIRNRAGFLAVFKTVCLQNGGLLDVSHIARETGLSRATVTAHLDALEIAHAVIRIPPFHGGGMKEIVRQPRVYAFDTGMVAHVRGWHDIREEDRGRLWENLVLDELRSGFPPASIHYWRDTAKREVDFVVEQGRVAHAIEAKINPERFQRDGLDAFRALHPKGRNFVVCPHVANPYPLRRDGLSLTVCAPAHLPDLVLI